jgi:hypothetical protein
MMIVVVKVMLGATGSRLSSGITGDRLAADSAPDTKASARRQCTSAGCAGVARFVRFTGRRQILRGRAARHAMNRFYGRSHGLGIRLRPAKVAGEPLKKLIDLLAFDGDSDVLVLVWIGKLWIGRIRMVCGHGNLIADIVGEFAR